MSKETKPQIYFLIRRGWHDQLLRLCDGVIAKKGKDPMITYWKAYALGMTGNIPECLRQLESFQSRRDMQFPVTLALLFFHNRARQLDHDTIDSLTSELAIAEDVTVSWVTNEIGWLGYTFYAATAISRYMSKIFANVDKIKIIKLKFRGMEVCQNKYSIKKQNDLRPYFIGMYYDNVIVIIYSFIFFELLFWFDYCSFHRLCCFYYDHFYYLIYLQLLSLFQSLDFLSFCLFVNIFIYLFVYL